MSLRPAAIAAVVLLIGGAGAAAQSPADTFTAVATVKRGAAAATAPVTIAVARYASESDGAALVAALRERGMPGVRSFLAGQLDVGYIDVGGRRTPVRYAAQRPTASGRLVTVVTAEPLLFIGASHPAAAPREGFELGIAILDLDAAHTGTGELAPAAKVAADADGALVITDYGSTVVWLSGLARVQ